MQTIVRGNLLAAQMASGGPEAGQPVGSAGEALTHFRDDTDDVTQLIDGVVDVSGGAVFVAIAGFVLCLADARAAAVLVLPLVGGGGGDQGARRSDQGVPGRRPGGDGGGDRAGRRHDGGGHDGEGQRCRRQHAGAARRCSSTGAAATAVRDRVLSEGVFAFSTGAADVGFGLIIVVSAGAIASGSFNVGTLALFAAYLGWLSFMPRMVGRVLARRKQAGVAFDRMRRSGGRRGRAQHGQAPLAAARGVAARRRPDGRAPGAGAVASASTWSTVAARYPSGEARSGRSRSAPSGAASR